MSNEFLPKLRNDLEISVISQDGVKYVILKDPLEIAKEPAVITYNFFLLLNLLNSGFTEEQYKTIFEEITSSTEGYTFFLEQIQLLKDMFILQSEDLKKKIIEFENNYLELKIRPFKFGNNSYPIDKTEFEKFYKDFFETSDSNNYDGNAQAIIVPHIDFNLGELSHSVYSPAYHSIKNTEADLFVIFGTSHHSFTDYFMFSKKDFDTPIGIVETDIELLKILENELENKLIYDEFAHRVEHSIEFQVVNLKSYFGKKNFKILPILVGPFYEFVNKDTIPECNRKIKEFYQKLSEIIEKSGRKAVYIASVDFAHIGRRFDDDFDAQDMLETLKSEDSVLIEHIKNSSPDEFLKKISNDKDKWKICGTSPIYSLLKILNPSNVKFLKYSQWNDSPTNSAVSFASFALYK